MDIAFKILKATSFDYRKKYIVKFNPLFQELEKNSLIVRNKLLKYNLCKTDKNFHDILSGCEALREQDYRVMSEFYSAIQ